MYIFISESTKNLGDIDSTQINPTQQNSTRLIEAGKAKRWQFHCVKKWSIRPKLYFPAFLYLFQ